LFTNGFILPAQQPVAAGDVPEKVLSDAFVVLVPGIGRINSHLTGIFTVDSLKAT
jgi:hypothetical protein